MCRDCRGCRLAGPACRSAGRRACLQVCRAPGLAADLPGARPHRLLVRRPHRLLVRRPQVVKAASQPSAATRASRWKRPAQADTRSSPPKPRPAWVAATRENTPARAETVRPRADNGIHRAVTRHAAGSPTKTGTAEATCRAPVRLSELALRSALSLVGSVGKIPAPTKPVPAAAIRIGTRTATAAVASVGPEPPSAGEPPRLPTPGSVPRARRNPKAAHPVRMPVIQKLDVWVHPVASRARALTGSRRRS